MEELLMLSAVSPSVKRRAGFLFTLDAIIAAMLIIASLLLLMTLREYDSDTVQISSSSQDVLQSMSSMTLSEMDNLWVQQLIANHSINNTNITVLEQIGQFWATGDMQSARMLSQILLNGTYEDYGLTLSIEGTTLYERNTTKSGEDTAVASRMITGIAQGKSLSGSSASAYLRKIKDKRTAAFLSFGGFIGQGNISGVFPSIPADANITNVTMELSARSPFTLKINNIVCGGTFTPPTANFTPGIWDITSCASSFVPGIENNISLQFSTALNTSYVAGGYIRVKYLTDQINELGTTGVSRQYLPGVSGIINIYDAMYVPGTLKNMSVRLHYNTTADTHMTIGNSRVYSSNATGEVQVVLNDENLTTFPSLLDYSTMSNTTIPFRVASYNSSVQIIVGSNADIVLITDVSGSMGWRLDMDYQQGNKRSCNNPDVYHKDDTERLSLAQCLDQEFTDVAMNTSIPNNLNRQWLVKFSDSASYYSNDPSLLTHDNLINQIQNYKNPSGGTCIACALNLAYQILSTYSPANKTRFVVLMTDGIPSYCTTSNSYCNTDGTGTVGTYSPAGCVGDTTDCSTNDCNNPIYNAINASRRLRRDLNASVYTIGIGPVTIAGCSKSDYLLSTIANETNASYHASRNASELREIYNEIAFDILLRSSQTSQLVTVATNSSGSSLYPDSYIVYMIR
jgi:hypothetical protein